MKKFTIGFVVGALIFTMLGALAAVTYIAKPLDYKVVVNGEEFVSDPPALEVEGRTYLPLRAMGDALGVPVNWNEELRQAEVGTTSAPTSETLQYSRTNPAPLNTLQTYTSTSNYFEEDNYTVNIRVMEIVRGDAAYSALKSGSPAYPPADDGYEYLNAKIAVSVLNTKGDYSVKVTQGDFKTFTSNNEECPYNYYLSTEPALQGSLYSGGNTEGWITVMVKKDDANPKLVYGLDYNGSGGIWFNLK